MNEDKRMGLVHQAVGDFGSISPGRSSSPGTGSASTGTWRTPADR